MHSVTKLAFFYLHTISLLHHSLPDLVAETHIHAFIISRLNYWNGVLPGIRLQFIQNSAARVLTHTRHWQHITPTLIHLHWLPIKYHIQYKILLYTYNQLKPLVNSNLFSKQFCSTGLQPHALTHLDFVFFSLCVSY